MRSCSDCYYQDLPENEYPCRECDQGNGNLMLWRAKNSAVDHPTHYNRNDAVECIDEMLMVFGADVVAHFCICNVWKYRYRAGEKGHEDDVAKSDWYMRKYKELKHK